MIKGLKLQKNSQPLSRNIKVAIAVVVLLLLVAGGVTVWYFYAYKPAQVKEDVRRREEQQLANDIKTVEKYYLKSLTGGSITQFTKLASEISKSQNILAEFNYTNETFVCDPQSCSFSYQLNKGNVFNIAQKNFWGENYTAIFSDDAVNFSGIQSGLSDNPLLSAYKNKADITAPFCGDLLNYLYSYNSISGIQQTLKIVSLPGSPVQTNENKIAKKGRGKYYGLNTMNWEMEIPKTSKNGIDVLYVASILERQAFRDAFIIQKIDSVKDNKISGVMVCKIGN